MNKKSKIALRSAGPIAPPTPADILRLDRVARDRHVDASDLPLGAGHISPAAGPIRTAILRQINRLRLSPYRLWKTAQERNPKLSASQVYEYLKGERNLTSESLESLVEAAGLSVSPAQDVQVRAKAEPSARKRPAAAQRE